MFSYEDIEELNENYSLEQYRSKVKRYYEKNNRSKTFWDFEKEDETGYKIFSLYSLNAFDDWQAFESEKEKQMHEILQFLNKRVISGGRRYPLESLIDSIKYSRSSNLKFDYMEFFEFCKTRSFEAYKELYDDWKDNRDTGISLDEFKKQYYPGIERDMSKHDELKYKKYLEEEEEEDDV